LARSDVASPSAAGTDVAIESAASSSRQRPTLGSGCDPPLPGEPRARCARTSRGLRATTSQPPLAAERSMGRDHPRPRRRSGPDERVHDRRRVERATAPPSEAEPMSVRPAQTMPSWPTARILLTRNEHRRFRCPCRGR
jgi:hypothetical protein